MRNYNSALACDQAWMKDRPWCCENKYPPPPKSHNSPTITEDGDLILIRFHEGPLLIQLIVPWDRMEVCPLWILVALCKLYYLLLWLHSSLCPASVMGLMTQAPHCALCDKAIISHGPADWDKTYLSLRWCFWAFLYFSYCLCFCFGSADVKWACF